MNRVRVAGNSVESGWFGTCGGQWGVSDVKRVSLGTQGPLKRLPTPRERSLGPSTSETPSLREVSPIGTRGSMGRDTEREIREWCRVRDVCARRRDGACVSCTETIGGGTGWGGGGPLTKKCSGVEHNHYNPTAALENSSAL